MPRAVALLILLLASGASAQSDLDTFMAEVLARRDENWKKLQQYTLSEDETFRLTGPNGRRLYGFAREYDWFLREDGVFVRSPIRADGVAIGEEDRRRAEDRWIREEQQREERAGQRRAEADGGDAGLNDLVDPGNQPRFVSSAYFLKFKFEPGRYALVGREQLLGREVLRIEYYPQRLFGDDKARGAGEVRMNRAMNKVSLVTLWVEPAERQILQYDFRNIDFDFLPGRSLARMDDISATMRMGQPFPGVWLPDRIDMRFAMTLAMGTFDARYDVRYRDHKEAVTGARIR
ncbi:MAG: hypothetical protein AB7P99_08295 [Vicinamibacterales bacterium]